MKNEREILKRMEHDALLRERLAWLQRAVANCERSIARNTQQLQALTDEATEADVTVARFEQEFS